MALGELLDARVHLSESDYLLKKKEKTITPFLHFTCLQLSVNYMYSLKLSYLHLHSQDENFYRTIFIAHLFFIEYFMRA